MKILILTGKFGMGHYQAAQAIKEELENNPKDDIEIIDWIEYLTPGCAKYIYAGYSSLIGHNTFFYNYHYRKSENYPPNRTPGTPPPPLGKYAPSASAETSGSDYLRSGILLSGRFLL